jgi:hypothetical protein
MKKLTTTRIIALSLAIAIGLGAFAAGRTSGVAYKDPTGDDLINPKAPPALALKAPPL